MDSVGVLIVVVVLLIGAGLVYLFDGDDVVEGDDGVGKCLTTYDYYWNGSEKACVKIGSVEGDEDRYQVSDFSKCISAGYPIVESYPRKCETPRGEVFVDGLLE